MQVSEKIIEVALNKATKDKSLIEEFINDFSTSQKLLWIYLNEELFPILTEKEATYFLFMLFILYSSIRMSGKDMVKISLDTFQKAEEDNWEIFNASKTNNFRDSLNLFFEDYKEEDLLAFIEDMLTLEENDEITPIGREPIFVFCKSFVDVVV